MCFHITIHASASVLVVGSVNIDTYLPVERMPQEGENLTTLRMPWHQWGGKGLTQAVALSKLMKGKVCLVGQVGYDLPDPSDILSSSSLLWQCGSHQQLPCGRGYITLCESTGQVSAIVSGGSNENGWDEWKTMAEQFQQQPTMIWPYLHQLIQSQHIQCVLLQCEIPDFVNQFLCRYVKTHFPHIITVQDVGGADRPMHHLVCVDYLMPNETELQRLVQKMKSENYDSHSSNNPLSTVMEQVQFLQQHCHANHVIVTQGRQGATWFPPRSSDTITTNRPSHVPAVPVTTVVDETGAGDCFRAAFVAALLQGQEQPLAWATAAGACAVQTMGAVAAAPTLEQVQEQYDRALSLWQSVEERGENNRQSLVTPRIKESDRHTADRDSIQNFATAESAKETEFPFLIGSRLNSMKDRWDLWSTDETNSKGSVMEWLKRQATIPGLTCVDFNYPQHFHSHSLSELRDALAACRLQAGAVCLRYPAERFALGSFVHPDAQRREEAIQMTLEAAEAALFLNCREVVVWSAFDGYDYPFQIEYRQKWQQMVQAFQRCCDAYPQIKFSLEFKPTDENTRFFLVPSTGTALLLCQDVQRDNFGLTMDVGHMLMAGENPAQSIALVAQYDKLFGIQLNDGYTRLAAEDGLLFGSVHPSMALEVMYQLHQANYQGHFYFDTFPQRSDPVKEAIYNIQQVKALWKAACSLNATKLKHITDQHDGIAACEVVRDAMKRL
jgi:sugar/nucleoside kinase (ribokinase family)/sugar phosphate isomerase/epimerase